MKGQYLTLEYALYFAIGVGIIIGIYYLFSSINQSFEKDTTEYQLKMVGELITGAAINILEASNSTNSIIYYNLSIPTKLSRCVYSIKTVSATSNLLLNCTEITGIGVSLTLYNFNIQTKNNIVIYSTSGLIKMKAKGGEVDLE
jgi:hypothetical protein